MEYDFTKVLPNENSKSCRIKIAIFVEKVHTEEMQKCSNSTKSMSELESDRFLVGQTRRVVAACFVKQILYVVDPKYRLCHFVQLTS